jgi:hypothetical protein
MDSSEYSKSFLKHVFNFDDDSKSDILNILQYSLIAIIPVVILNKLMQKYIPESDNKKSSLEIYFEVLIQIIIIFMGLLLIHRIITYIPTYSGAKYPEFHIIYIILAILMIIMSLQTKLGDKVSILTDRVFELWNGKQDNKKNSNKNENVKVSQPISGQKTSNYSDVTAISSLPSYESSNQNTLEPQKLPNYNAMYRQDTTPLIDASNPSMTENMSMMEEPVAANSVLGGSFGSTW